MILMSVQIALFTSEFIERPDLMFAGINTKLGNILDGMPTILNLPLDVPPEVPLVQVKSVIEMYELNVSRNRVDFIIKPNREKISTPSEIIKSRKIQFDKYLKAVSSMVNVNRMGLILTLFEENSDNVRLIADKYLTEKYIDGMSEVALHTNKQSLVKGIIYNSIRNIEATTIQIGEKLCPGIQVQYDLNNMPLEKGAITLDTMSYIISMGESYMKDGALKGLI